MAAIGSPSGSRFSRRSPSVSFEDGDVDSALRPDVHHRFGGHQSLLAAGQDALEFGLRHIGQERVVLCPVDAGSGDKLTAAGAKSDQRVALDASRLGAKDEFEFDPDDVAGVRAFRRQEF